MKVNLSTGEAQVGVKYDKQTVKIGKDHVVKEAVIETVKKGDKTKTKMVMKPKMGPDGRGVVIPAPTVEQRTTEMKITLATGQEMKVTLACHTGDQFCYAQGRWAALLKLFKLDTEGAIKKAQQAAMRSGSTDQQVKAVLTEMDMKVPSFLQDAKKFYLLPRADRTILFKAICRSFYQDAPDRVEQRERAELARLTKKYEEKPAAEPLAKAAK